jgi:hypothetical protein
LSARQNPLTLSETAWKPAPHDLRCEGRETLSSAWPNGAPKVGEVAEMRRTVAATDIERFTEISGDRNPLHYDLLAAQASRFGEIVVGHSGSAPVSCEGHPSGDRENLTARLARAHSVMTPAP